MASNSTSEFHFYKSAKFMTRVNNLLQVLAKTDIGYLRRRLREDLNLPKEETKLYNRQEIIELSIVFSTIAKMPEFLKVLDSIIDEKPQLREMVTFMQSGGKL